jgi:SAM-dependent methyltransferase
MSSSVSGLSRRTTCRLCDSPRLEKVVPIHAIPIADAYLPASQDDECCELYPVDLYFCDECHHVQLLDIVDPRLLFSNYIYVTGTSPGLIEHFRQYRDAILDRFSFGSGRQMVEIGSNAGVLLGFFQERGLKVLGIDPAVEIAKEATDKGLETWPAFFNLETAQRILRERGPASLIAANNVFAHSDDLNGMARGISELLTPDGIFVFEVSYLVDVVEKMLFDTVYHEHLSFHSVNPLARFLKHNGLELIDVQRVVTKGGSIRCLAQKIGGPYPIEPSVQAFSQYETDHGFDRAEIYRDYSKKINQCRDAVLEFLKQAQREGKTIVGFGAAPAITTLIYQFELAPFLKFIVDDNPRKHHRFSPGYKIPILPTSALAETKPNYVLVLAWTYADRIMENYRSISDWGGKFIVPLPELQVTDPRTMPAATRNK